MFNLKNGSKKLKKGITYLSLLTLLTPMTLQSQQVLAEEMTEPSSSNIVTEESTMDSIESTETTSEVELEKNTVELPISDNSLEQLPIIAENEIKGMYTIGQTSDGRVIQAAGVKKNTMFRSAGNIQGDVIRITIAGVLYEGIKITIDGKGALCIDQNLRAPFESNVPYDNGVPYENIGVKAILAHGAYGPNNPNPTDEEILLTEIALRNWLTGKLTPNEAISNSHPYVANLISKARAGDYFDKKIGFSDKSVEATVIGKEQVTKEIKVTGDPDNHVSIPILSGVMLTNVTTGEKVTNGTAKVYGGQSFKMSAPLNYNEKYSSGKVKSAYGAYTALMFTPFDAGYQRLMQGNFGDPLEVEGFSVNFFARTGTLEFQKLSEFSNLPMAGVTYKVEEPGKAAYEMKTDAEGKLKFNDVTHGTTIKVTEISNPIGWVLDPTTYSLTAEAGETLTKPLINSLQMGRIKGIKEQRVLDTEETKKQGKPIYKYIPLAGATFDLVAEKDILLPDGKTVYVKAGTVVDTVVTDEKGYFESTKDLLIGEDNFYRLVETNVPEGFRAPSEDQTLFSIPNGNNTEKLIVYDMGTINNDLQTGKLKFLKQDSTDLFGISGAQFTVEMMSGLYAGTYFTFTTEAAGNEFELPAGDWKLTEVKLPTGYIFDEETPQTQWVTIKDNETIELKWNNKKSKPVIQTKAHTADGSQTFTHGDVLAMYDDVSITHDTIDGTKGAFETLLYAILPDGTQKLIWKSDMIDYVINDKEFVKTVVTEEIDTSKYPKGTYFSFKEINYDDKGKENGRHNDDLTEKSQSIYPKETPAAPNAPTKAGTLPTTGEMIQSTLLMIGLMVVAVAGLLFQKKYELD